MTELHIPKVEPSRRGEVIALCALLFTVGAWFAAESRDKGAMQKSQEFSSTLLTQRNRENDAMREDIKDLRAMVVNCGRVVSHEKREE